MEFEFVLGGEEFAARFGEENLEEGEGEEQRRRTWSEWLRGLVGGLVVGGETCVLPLTSGVRVAMIVMLTGFVISYLSSARSTSKSPPSPRSLPPLLPF